MIKNLMVLYFDILKYQKDRDLPLRVLENITVYFID